MQNRQSATVRQRAFLTYMLSSVFVRLQRLFLRQAPNMLEPTSRYCNVRFVRCLWSRELLPSANSSFGDVITTLNSISTALISICTSKYLTAYLRVFSLSWKRVDVINAVTSCTMIYIKCLHVFYPRRLQHVFPTCLLKTAPHNTNTKLMVYISGCTQHSM